MKIKIKKILIYSLIVVCLIIIFILGILHASVHEGNWIYTYKYIKKLNDNNVGIVKMSENKYLTRDDEQNEGIIYLFESNGYEIEVFWNHGRYRKKGQDEWKRISGEIVTQGYCIWTIPEGELRELNNDSINDETSFEGI